MIDQLWGIGGAVAGILATGGTSLWVERAKLRQSSAEVKRVANRDRCQQFLTEIEIDERAAWSHEEQYGVLPGDAGHEEVTAIARARLTELELHLPGMLYTAAKELVDQLEAWAFGGRPVSTYREARQEFVKVFRREL